MLVCENENFFAFGECELPWIFYMQLLAQITCISRFFLLTLYTQLTRQLRQPRQPKVNKKIDPVVVNNNTHTINHIYEVHNKKRSGDGV